jgi:cyclopropane-fatty-acyl-phospholipid synthase
MRLPLFRSRALSNDLKANPDLAGFRESLPLRWLEGVCTGSITVGLPGGKSLSSKGATPGPDAALQVNDLTMVMRSLVAGDVGFAESYIKGGWDTSDLRKVIEFGVRNQDVLSSVMSPSKISNFVIRLRHRLNANSRRGSVRNIAAHYDLGNAFYSHWLDETMTYSSALFETRDEPLADAQKRKYRRLAKKLELEPGDRVLEIGCGWGGFAEVAAGEFGSHVICLTLSEEQAKYARGRIARAGLSGKVEVRLEDYRDVNGVFDKIVSIEMFEAVGEKYWPIFFEVLRQSLKSSGRAALQVITLRDDKFDDYRRHPDFIQRFIFPGGMLPSAEMLARVANRAGIEILDVFYFGQSYAETLRRWDRAFRECWPEILSLGFDEPFRRMWQYYLNYCEVGFDLGEINVGHFLLSPAGVDYKPR